jgi:hypothetical protein
MSAMSYKRFDPQGLGLQTSVILSAPFWVPGRDPFDANPEPLTKAFFAFLLSIFTLTAEEKEEIYV